MVRGAGIQSREFVMGVRDGQILYHQREVPEKGP